MVDLTKDELDNLEALIAYADPTAPLDHQVVYSALRNAAPSLLASAKALAEAQARVKELEAGVKASTRAINAAIEQAHAEYQGHDNRADKFDKIVCEYRNLAARLLNQGEAG